MIMSDTLKKVGNYRLIRKIGSGATSQVFQGRKEGELQKYAIKMIKLAGISKEQKELIAKQMSIIKSIEHKNIVKLYEHLQTTNNYYLVFQFCENGDLEKYLKNYYGPLIPEETVQSVIYCVADALALIHSKGIVHRDIKLANILLKKDFSIKLADFGFAKNLNSEQEMLKTYCGTPITMAPQILEGKYYDKKCDIWSLGIILFQLIYGKLPFSIKAGFSKFVEMVINEDIEIPSHPQMPQQFKKLILDTLQKDPVKRLSIEDFLANPWVEAGNHTSIKAKKQRKFQSVEQILRSFSTEHHFDHKNETKASAIQAIVAARIVQLITQEINRLAQDYESRRQSIKAALNPDWSQMIDLLYFLDYKYLECLKRKPFKLIKDNAETTISLENLRGLRIPEPLGKGIPKDKKIGQILFKHLKMLSKMVDISLENKKQIYELVIKILNIAKQFTFKVCLIFSHNFHQQIQLQEISQKIQKEQKIQSYDQNANYITIAIQYCQKDPKMKLVRDNIIQSCKNRLDDIQKQMHGFY